MLKVGLIGVGHLGNFHLQQWLEIENAELVGIFDSDTDRLQAISEKYGVQAFDSYSDLIDQVDAVDIVTPTINHYELAKEAIKKSKHVFIEKPISSNLAEAKDLQDLVKESGVKCQIGHVERFNPAMLSLTGMKLDPRFIEAHRLAEYNPRGTDVSVVLDLMIHDIDIVLALVKSDIRRVSASGVPIVSKSYDIANARIEFENKAVANLTASRISLKNMRKTRLFQKDAYIALDFLNKKSEIVTFDIEQANDEDLLLPIEVEDGTKKELLIKYPHPPEINAIQLELRAFVQAIEDDTTPIVSVQDGYKALKLAYQIIEKIELANN